MNTNAIINLDRTNTALIEHNPHFAAAERQKIGQNDLAAMAGMARENLTRILNDWQRHKVLSRLSGYYCLEDKIQLEHQAKL
jgi:DNA-binding IclR family transcriptional regulator